MNMIQTDIISFCGQRAFNINTAPVKKKILNKLETTYNIRIVAKHFEKFHEGHFKKLNNFPYQVCLKTNGNPYLLYLTKLHGKNQVIFVDKKIQHNYFLPRIIFSKLMFDDSLFNDTIIDGEMIQVPISDSSGHGKFDINKDKWIFMIHDLYVYKGTNLVDVPLNKRINLVYNMLQNEYKQDKYDTCRIEIKRYFGASEIREIVGEFIPKLRYTCRGLYFKPQYFSYNDILFNFDDSLIRDTTRVKYQSQTDNTVSMNIDNFSNPNNIINPISTISDEQPVKSVIVSTTETGDVIFDIEKTDILDEYSMYEKTGMKQGKKIGTLGILNSKISQMLQRTFESAKLNTRIEFYCRYNKKFNKWIPIKTC